MLAAVCRKFKEPLVVEEVHLRPPMATEVEVEIKACAICHSDIHYADGAWGGNLPAVYGHEAAGRVLSFGDAVTGFQTGDPVLVTLLRTCGCCPSCVGGRPARCEAGRDPMLSPLSLPDGTRVEHGLVTAGFAERVVVDQSQIIGIPESIPMDSASLLSCGVITGVGAAVNTVGVRPGSSVAVVGVGGVGLNAVQGAKICGAAKIIAVDVSKDKLEDAFEFGATDTLLVDDSKPHRKLKQLTGGRGVDFALVTVGAIEAHQAAMRYLAPSGTLVVVGLPPSGASISIQPELVAFLSQGIIGSSMGDTVLRRDIPYLLDLYDQGRLKLDELITGRFSLKDINRAIRSTVAGNARRNVIVF